MKLKFFVILLMTQFVMYGQDSQSNALEIDKLDKRMEILEGQKENLNKQSDLLEQDFEIKKKNLDTRFSENKIEIDKELSGVRSLIYTLGIGVLGLLLGYWFYFRSFIKRKTEEIAEDKINSYVANIVEVNKEKIINLIKSQDIELYVKENSSIQVITETEEDKNYLSKFFNEVNISNVSYVMKNEFINPPSDIDLVIFDDHRVTNSKHDLFNEYIQNSSNKDLLFVFFGDRFSAIERERVNFANSKFTLYNQIINSLKYNELRK